MIQQIDFIHKEDEAARRELAAIPGFDKLASWFLRFGVEKYLHGVMMAQHIRLSRTQLPEIYRLLPEVCEGFGIEEPEFYLEMAPAPNAYTMGDERKFLVVTSGLLQHVVNEDERKAVLAHECGHIVCRHVFYSTIARMMVVLGDALGFVGDFIGPINVALNYWCRRSELSADRAAALFCASPEPMVRSLMRFSGGPESIIGKVNIEEFSKQAEAYKELQTNSKWHKLLQSCAVMNADHPFTSVRINELRKWSSTNEFQAMVRVFNAPHCATCGERIETGQNFCRRCGSRIPKTRKGTKRCSLKKE